jgi:hypothetical protein
MAGGWTIDGPSPFLTERARTRAPQVLDYAAAPGAAVLVSPDGDIALSSAPSLDIDLAHVARMATALGGARAVTSFASGGACVHAAPVRSGWMLCVVSLAGVSPVVTLERLRRAAHVLALALLDGAAPGTSGGSSGGPAPAEAFARARLKKD